MDQIPSFESAQLQAACKVLADTSNGLTGTEIDRILHEMQQPVSDEPGLSKWKRLFNAMARLQNERKLGNGLIIFITRAMSPVSYSRNREKFAWRQRELNVVLAFAGFRVRDDGKVIRTPKETTLAGAHARENRLRSALEDRKVHEEVFKYCKAELLQENHFHAVQEAIKGVAQRIRDLSGLSSDGAELAQTALGGSTPVLAVNALVTDSEKSEQKGICTLLIGLFGAVRNPLAHAPKIIWPMGEQDALDVLSLVSLLHRKLDGARKIWSR